MSEPLRDGVLLAATAAAAAAAAATAAGSGPDASAGMGVGEFASALRAFATEQLSAGGAWPAEASLKEYLCYSAPELEDEDWFEECVPDDLQLRHAYHTYHLLKGVGANPSSSSSPISD